MRKLLLACIFVLFLCFSFTYAQDNTIVNGVIYNSKTKDRIPVVHVVDNETGQGTTSNGIGSFRILISHFPVELEFSHISFKKHKIILRDNKSLEKKLRNGILKVYLDPESVIIDEVVIKGAYRKLLDKEPFHIFDFQFYENNIVLLGNRNNNIRKPELIIANIDGDLISSIKLKRSRNLGEAMGISTNQYQQITPGLYKDCFGNIHHITKDSVYQIHYDEKTLQLYFGIDHWNFKEYLLPVKIAIDNFLFCEETSENKQNITYFAISDNSPERLLKIIGESEKEESVNAIRKLLDDLYHPPCEKLTKKLYEDEPLKEAIYLKDDKNNFIYDRYANRVRDPIALAILDTIKDMDYNEQIIALEFRRRIVFKPVYSSIIDLNEKIYLFDFYDDKIEIYNKYGYHKGDIPINYHKHEDWQKQIIVDEINNKVYNLFIKKNRRLYLKEIDLITGLPIRIIDIPELKNIEKINIRDNKLYFLYQPITGYEKKKLYSMNF